MASLALQATEHVVTHPMCPFCAVAMWLGKIERHDSGDRRLARYHYKCRVCDALAVIPPLDA